MEKNTFQVTVHELDISEDIMDKWVALMEEIDAHNPYDALDIYLTEHAKRILNKKEIKRKEVKRIKHRTHVQKFVLGALEAEAIMNNRSLSRHVEMLMRRMISKTRTRKKVFKNRMATDGRVRKIQEDEEY